MSGRTESNLKNQMDNGQGSVLAILQARVSSRRLPGKVLQLILDRPMLALQIERIRRSQLIDELVVATSTDLSDNAIETLCTGVSVACHRGSLEDVLDRFHSAASEYFPSHVVRLTGDCPLADPELIDAVLRFYLEGDYDFVSNAIEPTFPDGLDVAVFRFSLLQQAWHEAKLPSEREHVTMFMRNHPERYRIGSFKGSPDRSGMRWTVDEPEDLAFVRAIYQHLYRERPDFRSEDIYHLLDREPDLLSLNSVYARNEGLQRSLRRDQERKMRNENSH